MQQAYHATGLALTESGLGYFGVQLQHRQRAYAASDMMDMTHTLFLRKQIPNWQKNMACQVAQLFLPTAPRSWKHSSGVSRRSLTHSVSEKANSKLAEEHGMSSCATFFTDRTSVMEALQWRFTPLSHTLCF